MTTTPQRTGWVGWIYFAGIIMILSGILNIIYAISAIAFPNWTVFTPGGLLLLNLNGWGWLHLIIGIVVMIAGFLVFSGNLFGRTIAVIMAGVSLIANFAWLPLYPFWSLVIITLDVLVIWAMIGHGDELER